jgi:AcrR family transcriptional regulator
MKRRRSRVARGPSTDTEARRTERRTQLLQAAQKAIERLGPQVSMDEIATEAGITKPIVYRHFGDRRGLAVALRDSVFSELLGPPTGDVAHDRAVARERLAVFLPVVTDVAELQRHIVNWAKSYQLYILMHGNIYRFLRAEGVLDSMWDDSDECSENPFRVMLAASLQEVFNKQIDENVAMVWAQAVRGMIRGLVDWSSSKRGPDRSELERQFDVLVTALLDGLGRTVDAKSTESRAHSGRRGQLGALPKSRRSS